MYNLIEKNTVSHHAWNEQDYIITNDFTIRADNGSNYDLSVYACDSKFANASLFSNKIDKMKFVIQETKTGLELEMPSVEIKERELLVEMGHDMVFCANKTSIMTLSQRFDGSYISILNFWLNKI